MESTKKPNKHIKITLVIMGIILFFLLAVVVVGGNSTTEVDNNAAQKSTRDVNQPESGKQQTVSAELETTADYKALFNSLFNCRDLSDYPNAYSQICDIGDGGTKHTLWILKDKNHPEYSNVCIYDDGDDNFEPYTIAKTDDSFDFCLLDSSDDDLGRMTQIGNLLYETNNSAELKLIHWQDKDGESKPIDVLVFGE